jgi:hypothetical protein
MGRLVITAWSGLACGFGRHLNRESDGVYRADDAPSHVRLLSDSHNTPTLRTRTRRNGLVAQELDSNRHCSRGRLIRHSKPDLEY